MKKTWKFLWIKIIILIIGSGLLFYFFFEDLRFEILGSAIGMMLTVVGADFVTSLLILREEKIKLISSKFTYDEVFYRKKFKINGKETDIWYDAIEYEGDPVYTVEDDPTKQFTLDSIIQNNFGEIMQAHLASFIANPMMIRLDDCKREADGTVKLFTSRTAFYNDLVTNRAMDYKFGGDMSVREIYENGRYLSPLGSSKMSNHIGFGAFIFYGNSMIVAHRGGNATLSKNQFTAALAFGFSEDDLRKVHDPLGSEQKAAERFPVLTADDLLVGILLVRMGDALNMPIPRVRELYEQKKITIHTLGFGQLIYTGGKPQFYFAIVIDKSVDLCPQKDKQQIREQKKKIDFNKNMVFADGIELVKEGGHVLRLKKSGTDKTVKGEAEKSFFVNYWHLLARPRIEGVPDWVYENSDIQARSE
ncbi:MAG: hypothetical protein J1G38_02100 [Clostridiales bacterium]|nr:hypothetical protein [Clostridiales bacterium]